MCIKILCFWHYIAKPIQKYTIYYIDIRGDVFLCMRICKQMIKKWWKRQKLWNNQKESKDFWNFFEIILCIRSYIFFKKSFLGFLLFNNLFKPYVVLENSAFQNAIRYFIFRNFCFTSCSTANLLNVMASRIAGCPNSLVVLVL